MHRAIEFLQDDNGTLSATRLAFLLTISIVITIWSIVSLEKGQLLPIDTSLLALITVLMAGKVAQKFVETGK